MSVFEGWIGQNGRGPGIWIGHVLSQRPNVREVGEILLGIAVMTQPLYYRNCQRVESRNSADSARCDSTQPPVMR